MWFGLGQETFLFGSHANCFDPNRSCAWSIIRCFVWEITWLVMMSVSWNAVFVALEGEVNIIHLCGVFFGVLISFDVVDQICIKHNHELFVSWLEDARNVWCMLLGIFSV